MRNSTHQTAPLTTHNSQLRINGIPTFYSDFILSVYDQLKHCRSIKEAKAIKFTGKKPGSLYVVANGNSILFFESPRQVFAKIEFP